MSEGKFDRMKSEEFLAVGKNHLEKVLKIIQKLHKISTCVKNLNIVTFQVPPTAETQKLADSLFRISEYVQHSRKSNYKYSFLVCKKDLETFLDRNGLITITHKNGSPMSINFSIIEKVDCEANHLIAGLTISATHNSGVPIFKYSTFNLVKYALEKSKVERRTCYVSSMVNDGPSFEFVHFFTKTTCFPFPGNHISRSELKVYRKISQQSFDLYIRENFPMAKICLNTNIVWSNKSIIGFNDSFSSCSLDSTLVYSSFIKNWISDYSTEDILVIGKLDMESLGFLNEELEYERAI